MRREAEDAARSALRRARDALDDDGGAAAAAGRGAKAKRARKR